MSEVIITVRPDGTMKVEGEGFETKALKKALEKAGEVTERHIGAEHAKTQDRQQQRT